MAIDPRLYEKYSGKSGDPYKKLGEALAQGAARKSERDAYKDMSLFERRRQGRIQGKQIVAVVTVIFVLIVVYSALRR